MVPGRMNGRIQGALTVMLLAMMSGCGGATKPAGHPEKGLPLRVPEPAMVTADPGGAGGEADEEPAPPEPGEVTAPCPFSWSPRELRASVLVIPEERAGRMMRPLYGALCACTRPGQSLYVVARMVPERGEVTAQTAERADLEARASARIDACLAARLEGRQYEPFEVGSDVVCEEAPPQEPPPRGPGEPKPFQPPRPACAGAPAGTTKISYPVHVDRRGEAR